MQEQDNEKELIEIGQNIKKRALKQALAELHDPNFRVPDGFIIPLRNTLYVEQVTDEAGENKTAGGIIIASDGLSQNTIVPCTGIIYVVGDEVSDMLFPGLKITFADVQYMEVMIQGKLYLKMYEHEVLGILPPRTYVYQGVHSASYLSRVKKLKMFADAAPRYAAKEANDKDRLEEEAKKLKFKR